MEPSELLCWRVTLSTQGQLHWTLGMGKNSAHTSPALCDHRAALCDHSPS